MRTTNEQRTSSSAPRDVSEPLEGNLFVSAYPPFSCWRAPIDSEVDRIMAKPARHRADVPLGIYVHLPFCLERCEYCYYRSFANPRTERVDHYLGSLADEFQWYGDRPALAGRPVRYAYFGGGTPSILSAAQLERLFRSVQRSFSWSDVEEVTFECSPRTVSPDRMRVLYDAGVTRVSMGVQQMNDDVLRKSGRVHLVHDVRRAYAEIRRFPFEVVNIDLIVGLVGETDRTFYNSLHDVIDLNPESITIYQLEIPPNTPLFRLLREQRVDAPATWRVKRRRLATGFEILQSSGYEIRSCYAAVRDPRRHAFRYQELQYRGADLVGLGISSFSYVDGAHYQNVSSLREYTSRVTDGLLPCHRGYVLTRDEQAIREFILQLKLGSVSVPYFREKYDFDVLRRLAAPLDLLIDDGLLRVDDRQVRLTRQGRLRVDRIVGEFYLPQHRGVDYW